MPISETTFVDRHGRAELLLSAVSSFNPAFAPVAEDIQIPFFTAFLAEVDGANAAVAEAEGDYTAKVEERNELLKNAKDRCSRVISQLQTNPAWSQHLTAIKRHYDKLRGYRPAQAKPPAGDGVETGEPAKKRNQGEQGHAEAARHIDNIATGLGKIADYASPVADITAAAITQLGADYAALNKEMGGLEHEVTVARKVRYKLYEEESGEKTGLRERMKAIKKAVRAQYGTRSSEYMAVKGIRV